MTNAELEKLSSQIEDARHTVQPFLTDSLHDIYIGTDSRKGLFLKEESDLFTDDERELLQNLHKLMAEAERIRSDIDIERDQVITAIERAELYPYSIIDESDIRPLPEVLKEVDGEKEEAEEALISCQELVEQMQTLGWTKYLDRFKEKKNPYGKIIKEVEKIIESISIVDTTDLLVSDAAKEKFISVPKSLLISVDTDYYTSRNRSIITPTDFSGEEKDKEYYTMLLQPYFFYHIKAVERMDMPTGEVEGMIKDAIQSFLLSLKEAVSTATADVTHIKRNPVDSITYPHTQITKLLRDGYTYEEKRAVQEYTVRSKPVNSYVTVTSIENLTGIEGRELSYEELGLCVAAANELLSGNEYVTTQMLYKTWSGGDSSTKLNKKQRAKKDELINTLRHEELRIDQREYKKDKHLKEDFITDRILDFAIAEGVTINGQFQEKCWKIKSMPVIMQHAFNMGQITTKPTAYFQIGLNMTYYPLRDYLYDEIHRIASDPLNTETASEKAVREKTEEKKKVEAEAEGKSYKPKRKHQRPVILFDTIYDKVYEGTRDKRTHRNIQDAAQTILTYWKKIGEITDYELLYDGVNGRAPKKKRSTGKIKDLAYGIEVSVRKNED